MILSSKLAIPDGDLDVFICFGFSNMQSDIDNPEKLKELMKGKTGEQKRLARSHLRTVLALRKNKRLAHALMCKL